MYVSKQFGLEELVKNHHIPPLVNWILVKRGRENGAACIKKKKKNLFKDTQVLRDDFITVIKGMAVFW